MDVTSFFIGASVGGFIGVGYRFVYEFAKDQIQHSGKPLRAVNTRAETRVFAQTVDASIEPNHIFLMWKSRMRAFVFHAEVCNATARGLQKRIGLDRPRQMEYLKILRDAGLIRVKERSKSVWLTDWTTRHRAIATLPYPRNVEPPDFITLPTFADGTHSTQNRQD